MVVEKAPTFFISDLHLDASRKNATEAFEHFLNSTIKGARALYILGDLVDSWIGDDDHSAFVRQLKVMLAQCSSSGTRLFFIHGNRDFLMGRKFSEDTAVKMLDEYKVIDLYGEKTLLLHGDSLCTDDIEYQQFRKKVRNPDWQHSVLGYPLYMRRMLAKYYRYRSQKANGKKTEEIMDVNNEAVIRTFEKYQATTMIHGHTHRPKRHKLDVNGRECERIVLGDWDHSGWYLKVQENSKELVEFAL